MTLALSTKMPLRGPLDLIQDLHERTTDWTDPYQVANAAAAVLSAELTYATAFVYRYDAAADELLLLSVHPSDGPGAEVVGTRSRLVGAALERAVRERSLQCSLNAYIDPDFVRSLPGETRSELVVPVCTSGAVHGVVRLVYSAPHRPEGRDQEVAGLIALQIAPALAGAAPEARDKGGRTQRAATRLQRLASLLASSDNLAPALQQLAEGAVELGGGEAALVLLRHGSRQALEVAAIAGDAPLQPGGLISMDGTIPGEAARAGRSRSWRRSEGEGSFGAGDTELRVRDALVVPLSSGGKTFGVIAVVNHTGDGAYPPEAVEWVQALAHQAAAIEPMRQVGPLRQRLSDNSLLAEVGRAVTGTLGLNEVLALVVRAAEMLIGTRGVALGMITDEGDGLLVSAASGALRESQGRIVPIHTSLMGWAVLSAEQVVSPCVSDDPRGFPHEVRQGPGVVVPLESRSRIWGALMATRAEGAPAPSDEDVDALRKLAGYASIAIDNAHLYREQTELSSALREQTEELKQAYAELRESQERLVVSEKMAALGRITAGIAHEINSPLGGILNCLQLAHSYAGEYQASIRSPQVTPEDHEAIATDLLDALNMAQAATRKVAQFVRTIKGQTRTGDEVVHQPFSVTEEVEGVLTLLGHEMRNRNVTVHTDIRSSISLVGDPGKFSLVLQNLVNNAIDAYEGAEGEVWVRCHEEEESVILEVEDRGCGIPESIRGRIFDYLFTTKDIGQGTGLGLSIVHSIVTTHFNGHIDLRSQVGVGTTFLVRFSPPRT